MRKKELKLVVTFHTTADAMAMEKACKEQNVPGRIIPVPRTISAGCGLAWCAALEEREEIAAMMKKAGIEEEDMHGIRKKKKTDTLNQNEVSVFLGSGIMRILNSFNKCS